MLDLSKFKKIGRTKTHTIFQSPEGHLIHVAHSAVNPQQKNDMRKLPSKHLTRAEIVRTYAGGGQVGPNGQVPNSPASPRASTDVQVKLPPDAIVAELSGENNNNVGGTIRDGSRDEIFVVGNMIFNVEAARKINQGKSNCKVRCSSDWSNRINVEEDHAIMGESTNPVMIAQIPTQHGLMPLLFDGHHRMYRAMSEGKNEVDGYLYTPEESLAIMQAPPDLMYKLRSNLKEISKPGFKPVQHFAKGGMVKKMADGGDVEEDTTDQAQPSFVSQFNQMQTPADQTQQQQALASYPTTAQMANAAQGDTTNAQTGTQFPWLEQETQQGGEEPALSNPTPALPQDQQPQQSGPNPFAQGLQEQAKALNEQKQGAVGQALQAGKLGAAEAETLSDPTTGVLTSLQNADKLYQGQLQQLQQHQQDLIQSVQSHQIDPRHAFAPGGVYGGTMGRIGAAIGLLFGGLGGVQSLGMVQNVINKNIDRDINAQKANLGSQENLLSANMRQYGNLIDAWNATKANQLTIAQLQLQQLAAQNKSPMAQYQAQQLSGQFDQQIAQLHQQIGMSQALMGASNQANQQNPNQPGHAANLLNYLRMINPQMAKDYEPRYIGPGAGMPDMFTQVPPSPEQRDKLAAQQELDQKLDELVSFARAHSGTVMNRAVVNQGKALANGVMDTYRRSTGGGVFREAEKKFVNSMINGDPTAIGQFRTLPGYLQIKQDNLIARQSILRSLGASVPDIAPQFAKAKTAK